MTPAGDRRRAAERADWARHTPEAIASRQRDREAGSVVVASWVRVLRDGVGTRGSPPGSGLVGFDQLEQEPVGVEEPRGFLERLEDLAPGLVGLARLVRSFARR